VVARTPTLILIPSLKKSPEEPEEEGFSQAAATMLKLELNNDSLPK